MLVFYGEGSSFCIDQVDEKLGPVMESIEADAAHGPVEEPRVGRRPKFTEEEDLILVREVAAAKAHVAGHGEKRERYETVALRVNGNPAVLVHVNAKSVQDRYVKLQLNTTYKTARSGI
jgi:hypothetical protein